MIVTSLIGLFILISGAAFLLGYMQFQSTMRSKLISDRTVANMAAIILLEHEKATRGILESYASRPSFIDSVKSRDASSAKEHLADLKKNNKEMDLTFLTDPNGILWANYPVFPEALGSDMSYRDWYKVISTTWRPYISSVFKLIIEDRPLAVAVCVPVFDEKGGVVGILANSHRLGFISDIFTSFKLDSNETISVIDQAGHILYNNRLSYAEKITDYPSYPDIEQAVRERKTDLERDAPRNVQGKRYLAIAPLEDIGWTVIVERDRHDTARSEFKNFIRIGTIAALLFLLLAVFIVYQYFLYRKTADLLQTESQLRHNEERYKYLVDNIPDILYNFSSKRFGIYYSPQVESVLGYSAEYLKNHPTLWHDSIHPDDVAVVNQAIQKAAPGQKIELEYRIHDAHGKWHWFFDRSAGITEEAGETLITGLATDITEKKQAEKALQEQHLRLANIIDGTRVGTWEWNIQTGETVFNERWAEILGYTLDELAPISIATWRDLCHPDDFKQAGEQLERHFAGELPNYNSESRMKHKDGHWIWILDRGRVTTFTGDGKPLMMYGTHTDISERKLAEEKLGESKSRYHTAYTLMRRLCDNVPDMIWAKDLEKRYVFANEAVCRHLLNATDTNEPAGKVDMFFAERERARHPENPEWHTFGEICRDTDAITMEAGSPQQFDEYGNVQGKFLFLDVHKAPFIDDNGTMIGTVGSARDVTLAKDMEKKLRESEERLHTAAKAANFGVFRMTSSAAGPTTRPNSCPYMDCRPARSRNWMRT